MIPEGYVREWKAVAPWLNDRMVEQDLVISRVLIHIFSDPGLSAALLFRGGTALHKLYLAPASRYSEDIDLVQSQTGPIGPLFDALRDALGSFLDKPQRKQGPGVVALIYRIPQANASEKPLRLKVEINSREHVVVMDVEKRPFGVASRWFTGHCDVMSYRLEELLGTKLRALYQRRKGRDLFDLWLGLTQGNARPEGIAMCFRRYLEASGLKVSAREFRLNMKPKLTHPDFVHDTDDLLRPGIVFDIPTAYAQLDQEILSLL